MQTEVILSLEGSGKVVGAYSRLTEISQIPAVGDQVRFGGLDDELLEGKVVFRCFDLVEATDPLEGQPRSISVTLVLRDVIPSP